MLAVGATRVGALPPIVTVTVSIDCFAFDGCPAAAVLTVVITSSPHCAGKPPYCACCCTAQLGTPEGTETTIWVSFQLLTDALTPPIVTVPVPAPKPSWRTTCFA